MTADPAHRHGGPDAGWYVPSDHGWQRISDGEVSDHGDAAHFMSDPNGRTMGNPTVQVGWAMDYIQQRYGPQPRPAQRNLPPSRMVPVRRHSRARRPGH